MSQVSFGASVEAKLYERYVFGQDYAFQVAVSKVEAPTNPYTNHWLLNEENVEYIYGLIHSTNIVRTQISSMILWPKKYVGSNTVQIDFDAEGVRESFMTLDRAHIYDHEEGLEARKAFLNCFT